jgi:hypothetical protein
VGLVCVLDQLEELAQVPVPGASLFLSQTALVLATPVLVSADPAAVPELE